MPVQSVNLPEGLKEELDERMERGDYQNVSEFIRESIREKLRKETPIRPEEIQRIMNVREREEKGEPEWIPWEEMLERLDMDESELRG
ncbi:MAG: ribbon-helix-helix domain-containing protein [Candidatus Nanohaloarchaea archaeon]